MDKPRLVEIIKVYPRVWGFRWIKNVVANEPIRGFSLYLGRWQFAFDGEAKP